MTDKETAMVDGGVAQKGGDLVDQDRAPLSPHVSRGLPVRQLAGLGHHPAPYQLLEYQTDMRRCRFDTLGKQTSAHLAGGPTPYTGEKPHRCTVCEFFTIRFLLNADINSVQKVSHFPG